MELDREEVVARRISALELDRPMGPRALTDAAVFDLGVQDTGRDGASWALANRGVPVSSAVELEASPDVALVWTLRSAPHYYRRPDLPEVAVATSPFSDRDAAKRVVGADKPLRAAGIPTREGLSQVARGLHDLVTEPMVKGEVSGRLSASLPEPHLRDCVPCGTRHVWEVPFRISALYAGLELTPGTSPPVLRPIPDWSRPLGPADDPSAASPRLQVIRAYLRLLGPATVQEVAAFLDAAAADVRAHWPPEAVEVAVGGRMLWSVPGDEPGQQPGRVPRAELLRLLGPYDLLLQGRDRELLVPDRSRHKGLWPVLGRPGAVLAGTEVVGTWRPRAAGRRLSLAVDLWRPLAAATRGRIETEAQRLAAHREATLAGLEWTS